MISSVVRFAEYVYSSEYRLRKLMSNPYSVSAEKAGFSFELPNVIFSGVPPWTENTSYWALNGGRKPAVPCDTRSFNSSTLGRWTSWLRRYAPDNR